MNPEILATLIGTAVVVFGWLVVITFQAGRQIEKINNIQSGMNILDVKVSDLQQSLKEIVQESKEEREELTTHMANTFNKLNNSILQLNEAIHKLDKDMAVHAAKVVPSRRQSGS